MTDDNQQTKVLCPDCGELSTVSGFGGEWISEWREFKFTCQFCGDSYVIKFIFEDTSPDQEDRR